MSKRQYATQGYRVYFDDFSVTHPVSNDLRRFMIATSLIIFVFHKLTVPACVISKVSRT